MKDKRWEIEKIAAEREHLWLQEEDLMDQIWALENRHYESEKMLQEHGKDLSKKVGDSKYLQNEMRDKEIKFASDRGEELAQLKLWKENLEKERMRIMDNLERVK